jgi:hypothetical protein
MKITINHDRHIDVHADQAALWQSEIAASLQRFGDRITRLEVHLSDENSQTKGGPDDIRCLIEARPAGQQPVSIEVREATADQAIREAIKTLERRLGNILDKARRERQKPIT